MQLTVLESTRPVLGSFGKAIEGSKSLNFGLSGGNNCDRSCRYHPAHESEDQVGRCYAYNTEVRFDRRELLKKMQRHEASNPADIVRLALREVRALRRSIPWFRISTSGSVPQPKDATPEFVKAFTELMETLEGYGIPVHFPVETAKKASFYRNFLKWRVVVRESCQSLRRFMVAAGATSFVAGTKEMTRTERITEAKRVAALRAKKTGRKVIVCPAVASRYIEQERLRQAGKYKAVAGAVEAKCGNCVACAEPHMDVVYPLH